MTTESDYDPVAQRFIPDRELVARVQRHMLANESEPERFVRQQWEAAFGATRVALDALRAIYPLERDAMDDETRLALDEALVAVESAYVHLDDCAENILGALILAVLRGRVTTHESLDSQGVPR